MTYKQLIPFIELYCKAIRYEGLLSEISKCVRVQMYLCGMSDEALANPVVNTICDVIAVSSIHKEVVSSDNRWSLPWKAQNAAKRWAEKVALELMEDKSDYESIKAKVISDSGLDNVTESMVS